MKLITTLAVVCLSASALAQGVRYDHRVATIATNYPPGAQVPVMAIPNAQVTICVDGNCGAMAAIFSNQALTVRTSNPMQADGQGNFGFWAATGTYFYKVVEPSGKVNGIFPITLGGSGGSSAVTQIIAGQNITISPTNGLGAVTINSTAAGGGPVVQVNGAPLITPSPVNFADSSSVRFTNPTIGEIQAEASLGLAMQVVPPIAGQFVTIFPTVGSSTGGGACSATATSLSGFGVTGPHSPLGGCTSTLTWGSFSLPSFVAPGNVTAIYAFAISSYPVNNTVWTGTCTDGIHGSGALAPGTSTWGTTQVTSIIAATGSSVPSISCTMTGASSVLTSATTTFLVDRIGLIVYYTGTPPPVDNTLQLVPPLYLNTTLNQMGVDSNLTLTALNLSGVTGSTQCLHADSSGNVSGTGIDCGSGGGGGSSVGTAGQLQMVGSTAGSFAASSATDNGTTLTVSKPIVVNDGTGQGGTFDGLEGTAATPAAGHQIVNANASTHTLNLSSNGGAFSPICTATNGQCGGGGGGTIPATSLVLKGSGSSGVSVSASPATDYQLTQGAWQHEGTTIAPTLAEQYNATEPSLLYEGSPQLLTGTSGNVFKMWWTCGYNVTGLCYAESVDAEVWQRAASPVIARANPGPAHGQVFHFGSTYYYYAGNSALGTTSFNRFESADGISWTLTHSAVLTIGGSGWDSSILGNLYVIPSSGTWLMMYEALGGGTRFQMGVASSADQGVTWTKFSGNPVISVNGGVNQAGGPEIHIVGGVYYVWGQCTVLPLTGDVPNEICRWHSPTFLSNSWVQDNGGNGVFTRASVDEGAGNPIGQVADPSMVEVNGSIYMAYEGVMAQNGTTPGAFHMKLATAPLTFAKIVQTNEGNATNFHSAGGFNSLNLFNVQGPTQCLHADGSGNVTGTGGDCSGGNITSALTVSGCVITGTQCVVTTPGATVTLSGIPAGFSSIEIIGNYNITTGGGAQNINAQFNGDTAAHYLWNQIFASGTSISAQTSGGLATSTVFGAAPGSGTSAAFAGSFDVLIPNYSGTTFNKTVIGQSTRMDSSAGNASVLQNDDTHWLSTAAITSITIFPASTSFVVGSTFSVIAKP